MAMKKKTELKDVFSGLSSIMIKQGGISDLATVSPEWDLPVTVDSLSMSQGEPTLNRTKVHGLSGDWCVTSTPGDFSFSATVPSVSKELVEYFMGGATQVTASTINDEKYKGFSVKSKTVKKYVGVVLLSEDEMKACVVKKLAIFATPLFENASTTPFGFKLTGSIELSDDDGDDIAFLEKDTNADAPTE
jgi:hypothetical protein|nr:MAG TPA: hypothetical protein [Caudoviricetes sp.]